MTGSDGAWQGGSPGASLDGRVAVVTGGASGIGRATVLAMSAAGASVVVADLNEAGADQVASEVVAHGGRAVAAAVDVSDEHRVATMTARAVDVFGGIDILANVAAITDLAHQARDLDVADAEIEIWRRTLDVDLVGAMLCAKHAITVMIERGGGAIVNVGSIAGILGVDGLAAYSAAKAGMHALTHSIATAYGKQGIRANTVSPGSIAGPSFLANLPPEVIDAQRDHVLLPELGTPEDVAAVIVFLASDAARYVTGQLLCVDGGATSHAAHWADVRRRGATMIRRTGA
jgi:NAD(P)-dependent dehydrogenase (short-subunit alcohol dehydrogenase family)